MNILVVGSAAYDSVETPFGKKDDVEDRFHRFQALTEFEGS